MKHEPESQSPSFSKAALPTRVPRVTAAQVWLYVTCVGTATAVGDPIGLPNFLDHLTCHGHVSILPTMVIGVTIHAYAIQYASSQRRTLAITFAVVAMTQTLVPILAQSFAGGPILHHYLHASMVCCQTIGIFACLYQAIYHKFEIPALVLF